MPGAIFSTGVRRVADDRSFAVERRAQHVDDASEQPLADRHLQQLAGGPDFAAFLEDAVVAEDDDAHLGLVEAQRQPGDAFAEVEHFVQHDAAETLDAGDAVADFADDADVALERRGLCAGDLRLDVLNQIGHAYSSAALRSVFTSVLPAPPGRP